MNNAETEYPERLDTVAHIEPPPDTFAALASIAVSLKRIADYYEWSKRESVEYRQRFAPRIGELGFAIHPDPQRDGRECGGKCGAIYDSVNQCASCPHKIY